MFRGINTVRERFRISENKTTFNRIYAAMRIFLLILPLTILFLNCSPDSDEFGAAEEAIYRNAVKTLASDEFMGRKPFTEGEEITLDWLEQTFKKVGLQPGNGDSYFQNVPMVEIKASLENDRMRLKTNNNRTLDLAALTEIVAGTRRVTARQPVTDAPLVFAGFGINAPEYNWNDYEGLDVKGKIVVVLINDPGFYNPDLFRGRDVTYYGRWTYKFEEAARQGAEGVLIIHDTEPASYGWSVVRSSWSKSKLFLQTPNDNIDFTALEGWISGEAAHALFEFAGVTDAQRLIDSAKEPGFEAVPLPVTLSGTIHNEIVKQESQNVIGILPGTTRKDEYIIYTAHWDHFGIGEPIQGDSIYHGAVDNATGVAALITLAEKFRQQKPPARSIVFFSPTGEEAGLLGSEYYASNPVYPLKNTVININFDVLQPFGLMKDIYIVGKGLSEADDYLEEAATAENRVVKAVEDPSDGWFYRSDHFNFAKVGVPVLYVANGIESVEHGADWGARQKALYTEERYHKPQDRYDDSWDVSGTMADLKLMFLVGKKLANNTDFPGWHDGIMYKQARETEK